MQALWLAVALFCTAGTSGCHKIDASARPGGSISPSGTVWVWNGSDKTFTMTPNAGNTIADVLVDGVSTPIWSTMTYMFSNVTANHALVVSFVTDSHYHVFNILYGTTGTKLEGCRTCHNPHMSPGSTTPAPIMNGYGNDVHAQRAAGYTRYQALKKTEPLDSDGDSFNNITEINARTYPGETSDRP